MRRPLRSKRAMISPVRLRANASGFTRIRVRSTWLSSGQVRLSGVARCGRLERGLFLGRPARPPPLALAPLGGRRTGARLGLAVRAQAPGRVHGLAAARAALLELAHAAGAAQVVALDLVLAVRAQLVVELQQARLGGLHLELAQAHVVQELRRADDRVDDRPHEREQRRKGRAPHEHRVVDAPAGAREPPEDQRGPGTISASPPSWATSEASVAGGSARGLGAAVQTTRRQRSISAPSIAPASLSSRIETTPI